MAVKHCEICDKEFVDYGRGKYCKGPHYTSCIICGKEFEYNPLHPVPKTCSPSCRSKLAYQSATYKKKLCPICNTEFVPESAAQKFCKNHS